MAEIPRLFMLSAPAGLTPRDIEATLQGLTKALGVASVGFQSISPYESYKGSVLMPVSNVLEMNVRSSWDGLAEKGMSDFSLKLRLPDDDARRLFLALQSRK